MTGAGVLVMLVATFGALIFPRYSLAWLMSGFGQIGGFVLFMLGVVQWLWQVAP
ncbi:MAG: hypothetical protein WCK28_00170 [Burkholderiales bacterium]|jgi:hypothetical protein